jgi:hypothetical protein
MTIPVGTLVVAHRRTQQDLSSARLDAPVVTAHPRAPRPRMRRTRHATATALRRAAARVSPA